MRDRSASSTAANSRGGTAYTAVGRRKRSVARVLIQPGNGNIIVNGIPFEQRFPRGSHQAAITLPLRLTNRLARRARALVITTSRIRSKPATAGL